MQINSIQNDNIPYFYYGSIIGADSTLTYLYLGAGKKAKVIIDKTIRNQLWQSMRVNKFWQIQNSQMICFGWFNKKDGVPYIVIKNLSNIAFIDIKVNNNYEEENLCNNQIISEDKQSLKRPEQCYFPSEEQKQPQPLNKSITQIKKEPSTIPNYISDRRIDPKSLSENNKSNTTPNLKTTSFFEKFVKIFFRK